MASSDWKIILEPADPKVEFSGDPWLEILPEGSDREDAIEALDGWAETLERRGSVPRSGDWQNEAAVAVTGKRQGLRYRVRCDTFERETDTGSTVGSGWLRAVEVPR